MKNKCCVLILGLLITASAWAGSELRTDVTPEGTYNEPQRREPALAPDAEKFEDLGQAEAEFHEQVNKTDPETKAAILKMEKRMGAGQSSEQ